MTLRTRFSEYGLFLGECVRTYRTTGAVLPSGRSLARALARFVADRPSPKHVLEVGPGTGAVTHQILACLGPDDRIDLVELNDRFVARLRQRFETDPAFQPAAGRARIHHGPVEDLAGHATYDVVISGLPLNNFAADEVERILAALRSLVRPGGTLSFFEYIGIRYARAIVSGRRERQRLRNIARLLNALLREHEIRREWIWPNVPPAWVHHVRFAPDPGGPNGRAGSAGLSENT